MSIWSDIANVEQKVVNFIKGIPQEGQDILSATNKFLNIVKVLSTSATAQTIIDIAEAFFPASTGIINGVEAVLAELLGLTAETPGQLLLQAAQKANAMTGIAKVTALGNIATVIASTANDLTKGTLTPQQIASVVQLVHNPAVLDTSAPVKTEQASPNVTA